MSDNKVLSIQKCVSLIIASGVMLGCNRGISYPTTNFFPSVSVGAGTGENGIGKGPAPINIGQAKTYVILAASAITTVPGSSVVGNLGISPAPSTYITGFSLSFPPSTFSVSDQVTGQVFASDYNTPTPANLNTAMLDLQAAYDDASGRAPDYTELGAGDLSGMTLPPAVYKWGTGVLINSDLVLSGGPNDVWIFQIAQDFTMASGIKIVLAGGALPKNIFWQTFGVADLGTTSHFEGILMSKTAIVMRTGASVNGRLFAQTGVTLDQNSVVQP